KDDLKQQITELVPERRHVAARDRVGHLIGLLDRIRRDRRKILLPVPRATALRIAQSRHDREQTVERTAHFSVTNGRDQFPNNSTTITRTMVRSRIDGELDPRRDGKIAQV